MSFASSARVLGDNRFDSSTDLVSTWTRFYLPPSRTVDWSDLRQAKAAVGAVGGCQEVYVGRIEESRNECMLVMVWQANWAFEYFKKSATWTKFVGQLKEISSQELVTQYVKFDSSRVWGECGQYKEVHTLHFAVPATIQKRESIKITLLKLVPRSLLPPRTSYTRQQSYFISRRQWHITRVKPHLGWQQGPTRFEGNPTLVCLWPHSWGDSENEYRVKRRLVGSGISEMVLQLEYERILAQKLKALELTSFHIWFDSL